MNQAQRINSNMVNSGWRTVSSGVPWVSFSGPVLLNNFKNDLDLGLKCTLTLLMTLNKEMLTALRTERPHREILTN